MKTTTKLTAKDLELINKQATFDLPCGCACMISVCCYDQARADVSDEVRASLRFWLPGEKFSTVYIRETLRFGERLSILTQKMEATWGLENKDKTHRYIEMLYKGNTWLEALKNACTAGYEELDKLRKAMQARLDVYNSEGKEFLAAAKIQESAESAV